ncbi:MAG TPA: amino acid adenylation domain-containing protein, partial [Thermoanaerobaculia bacterium]|nr:amino acid adenylation domain-containing protein [Thermoanaerobaculia bacterium]
GRCRREIDLEVRPYDAALARLGPGRSVWFFSVHHVFADARTLQILARHLSRLYELELSGRLEEAPPLPAFSECVAREAADRLSDRYRRARRYWEEKLARPAAPNPFYGRPDAAPTTRTERLSIELDDAESVKVRELAARRGLFSASVVFAGALFALLGRLSGERRLRLGTPFANRPDRLRDVPGLMVIAAPLEVEIAAGETFGSLLRKVQKELVAAARHQPYPVRNPVEAPAYDVYFNFQTMAFRDLCGQPVSFELLHSGHSLDRLDLQVSDFAATGRYRLDLDFNQAAFNANDRARTQDHYLSLLRALLTNDDLRLDEATLLSEQERQELSAFNATHRSFFATPTSLHGFFEAQASATPNAIAVVAEEGELTYAELDRRAARLADFLRLSGVTIDALVGVAMERSLDMVVALLGILKAGAAYVPIDPGYPQERIAWMLADARVPVLLTQSRLAPLPAPAGTRVVALDVEGPAIYAAAADTPLEEVPPVPSSGGAYMIYTSGSTGRPKGVLVPHEGIVNRLLWMQEAYGLAADDRVLQKTPYSFDVSVWEFFWPLLAGARLVMARPGGHQDPAYLVSVIAGQGITTVHFVPSMLRIFLEQPGVDLCRSLRRVIASGEALTETLVARYHERLPAPLHNLYGPTEASVDVTAWHCRPEDDLPFVPIGRPIANTTIHLLDADLNLLPVGIPGELHIGGIGLARGYHGRPELTAERFVPDPWADAARPGARLYKTGDLARHLPGGAVEYLGRIDHQVKIRGFRIELGEIESVLAQFPGVRQAAALCRFDGGRGEPRLVAYFVPEPGWGPSAAQLRGYLQSRLPDFMVPAAFVALDALPLTESGKVDRRALPAPALAAPEPDGGGAAASPRTPLESLIASVCAEVLGLDEVPLEANFFDLGGNSLSATQVVTLLQEVLPVEIDLRKIFEGPTVAKLAATLEEERAALSERERQVMAEILAEFEAGMSAEM